ncbi:FGFR2 [Branchiostoma lanceolatum]|uniref:FGFR2 protein n=1 Tax=Branchiostoma lanceolatum TaxID=7740 RepID=A0A8J9Z1A8_BRALA|nr:FGFR2 [Branchiostoma lanceolatum]
MPAVCRLLQTALIAMFLSPTLVRKGHGQTGIQNGGTVYVTAGSDADLQWTYTMPPGIAPLFQTWKKLPDTGIASRTIIEYISQAYKGRVELVGDAGLRLKNVTTSDSGTYQLYMVSSDGASQTFQLTLQGWLSYLYGVGRARRSFTGNDSRIDAEYNNSANNNNNKTNNCNPANSANTFYWCYTWHNDNPRSRNDNNQADESYWCYTHHNDNPRSRNDNNQAGVPFLWYTWHNDNPRSRNDNNYSVNNQADESYWCYTHHNDNPRSRNDNNYSVNNQADVPFLCYTWHNDNPRSRNNDQADNQADESYWCYTHHNDNPSGHTNSGNDHYLTCRHNDNPSSHNENNNSSTTPATVVTTATTATPAITTPGATHSTSPTTPVATTAPSTTLTVENDVYLRDDGITEVVSGGAAQLNWTYSLRPGGSILHEVWKDPDGNCIMRRIGNVVIGFDDYKDRVNIIGGSSLLLNGTGPADAGNYTFTASFSDVSEHEAERQLIVHYPPKVPQVEATPGSAVTEGDTVVLRATADCVPPATYTWGRLGGSLPTTAVVNTTLGTLTISGVTMEDSGVYIVVAWNYLGNSSVKNATVEVGPKPIAVAAIPPVGVTAVTSEGSHITPPPVNPPTSGQLTPLEIALIALGATLVLAILLAGGLRCWWGKKKRARAETQKGRWYFHPFILDRVYPLEQVPPPVPVRPQFLKYEVDRHHLELREQIGRGAFGVVHLATLRRTADGLPADRTVVVKTVHDGASVEEKATFVREIETTINLGQHQNLLGLVGCCTLSNPPYLVAEYMVYGDLKTFLLKCRQPLANVLNSVYDMTELKMYQIGRQIANGMIFISEAGYVHGDLAARNVLVGEDLVVKIADFGLATDVYERGYQRQDAEQKIPVRWMAPERLLREGRYTSKSDVWSFGVVLYEIAALGDVPYPSLGSTLLEELRRGHREHRPEGCPWELYNLMLSCWQWDEFSRPGFQQLHLELDRLVEKNADVSYLKLSSASSDDEKSSGIFTDSLASSKESLEAPSTSGTSQASGDLKENRAETSQPSVEDVRRSNEAEDVTIGQGNDSSKDRDQIQTNTGVSNRSPRKNKRLEKGKDNSDSNSAEVQFVNPRLSGRSSKYGAKIGAVYYKVPPKNNKRKQRQGSGKVIGEEQIEVLDLDSDFIESEALYF